MLVQRKRVISSNMLRDLYLNTFSSILLNVTNRAYDKIKK